MTLFGVVSAKLTRNPNKNDEGLLRGYYFDGDFDRRFRSDKSSSHSAGMGGCSRQSVCQGSDVFLI